MSAWLHLQLDILEDFAECSRLGKDSIPELSVVSNPLDASIDWKKRNPDKCKKHEREYRARNNEQLRKSDREWRERNREKIKERNRERYLRQTPERRAEIAAKRAQTRMAKKSSTRSTPFSDSQRAETPG